MACLMSATCAPKWWLVVEDGEVPESGISKACKECTTLRSAGNLRSSYVMLMCEAKNCSRGLQVVAAPLNDKVLRLIADKVVPQLQEEGERDAAHLALTLFRLPMWWRSGPGCRCAVEKCCKKCRRSTGNEQFFLGVPSFRHVLEPDFPWWKGVTRAVDIAPDSRGEVRWLKCGKITTGSTL